VSVVANVAINVDASKATQQLRAVQQGAQSTNQAIDKLNATTAAVESKFKVAANGVKYFTDATGRARAENGRFLSSSERAAAGLQAQGRAAQQATGQMSGLVGGIGRLAGAYLGLRAAQQAFQASIGMVESERRIAALSRAFGETAQAQEAAARAAQKFGLSQTEANQSFSQIYARLRPIGVSLAEIEVAYNGFNTAAKLSGASISESSSAWLQLSQALGSGVLRGEELNSVFEQTPAIVQGIAKEMGAPIGQIRQLAADGKITSDIVIRALKRIETEGASQLAEAMNGPAQQVKNLQNEFEKLQIATTKDLIPSMIDVVKELRGVLESLGPVLRSLGGIAAQTLGTVADLINVATKPRQEAAKIAIRGGRLPLAGLGGISGAEELFLGTSGAEGTGLTGIKKEAEKLSKMRREPITKVLAELMKNRLARMEAPASTPLPTLPTGVGAGAVLDPKAAKKAVSDAENAAKLAGKLAMDSAQYQMQIDGQVFRNQVDLDKLRYDLQRQLQEKQLDNFVNKFTGVAREQAGIIQSAVLGSAAFDTQIKELENKIKEAQQRLQSGTRMNQVQSTIVAGGGNGGFSASQLNTATQAASKFTGVANMCSESVKAFYGSLGITLPGVTAWADTVRKAGTVMTDFNKIKPGDILATGRPGDTPHVGVYTGGQNVFHQSSSRGLKAGNYPDLNLFKGGYFVRPNAAMGGGVSGVPGENVDQTKAEIQGLTQQLALIKSQAKSFTAVDLTGFILKSTSAFREQTAQLVHQTEAFTLRNRLQMEGVKPELIEGELKLLEVRQQLNDRLQPFNELLATGTMTQVQYADATDGIKTAAEAAAVAIQTYTAAVAAASSPIQQFIGSAQTQLKDLESVAVRVSQGIGDAVGNSLTKGIQGLVEGTTTAQQVFSDFLKSIGDILMQEGTKMIATYTAIAIAKSLAGLFGGGSLGGGGAGGAADGSGFGATAFGGGVGGGTGFGMPSILGKAVGGPVAGGTPYVVGEKGPELFVPGASGTIIPNDAMSRYQRQNNSAGAAGSGTGAAGNGSPASWAMNFETTQFLGQDWVSKDQLMAAMAATEKRATAAGAKAGAQQVATKMRTSPAFRRQVGI
jgi:tape measure domain-containing protein